MKMPFDQRWLRLPGALHDTQHSALPGSHRKPAGQEHRHFQVLQLHRHQITRAQGRRATAQIAASLTDFILDPL